MEIIARKSSRHLVLGIMFAAIGCLFILDMALTYAFEPEEFGLVEFIIVVVFGAAALAAAVVNFVIYGKNPKIIAWHDNGVFHFPDFECKSESILSVDFKANKTKSGTLIVYTKDGAHTYKNVGDVEFSFDKLAILILKREGFLYD